MPRISASTTLTSLPVGEKGPALRVQLWDDVKNGFLFENGSEGCTYLDVVVFNKNFYSCKTSHSKDSSVTPAAGVASDLWIGTSAFDLLATKLFFAQYALIQNLGVEALEMYARDASGNIIKNADGTNKVVALIKNGQIVINSGEFKDVAVAGNITADTLSLKICTASASEYPNGSLLLNKNTILLPELPSNTSRSYKILNPGYSRSGSGNLTLMGSSSKCLITSSRSTLDASNTLTIPSAGVNSGSAYELIGFNDGNTYGNTYWLAVEIPINNS